MSVGLRGQEPPSSRVGVTLRCTTNVNIGAGSFYTVTWDTEDDDTHDFWSSGTGIVIPTGLDGPYVVTAGWNQSTTGSMRSDLLNNIFSGTSVMVGPLGQRPNFISTGAWMPAGTTLSLRCFNAVGGTVALTTAWFSLYRIG